MTIPYFEKFTSGSQEKPDRKNGREEWRRGVEDMVEDRIDAQQEALLLYDLLGKTSDLMSRAVKSLRELFPFLPLTSTGRIRLERKGIDEAERRSQLIGDERGREKNPYLLSTKTSTKRGQDSGGTNCYSSNGGDLRRDNTTYS